MTDIVLINGYRVGRPVLPAGLGYVAQAIEDAGFRYLVCDVNLQTDDQILQVVRDSTPRYVGCGSMSFEVEKNYELLGAIRREFPGATMVLGGPHSIAANREVFTECASVDLVVQGEGEEAIVQLLRGVPATTIPGVLERESKAPEFPMQLLPIDRIAFPRYSGFDLEKYGATMSLASSRGCVYQCSFCGAPKFLGRKWRAFKAERMIEEFEYWYGRGYRDFYFSDSLFALEEDRVTAFCDHIVRSGYSDAVFTADGFRADHLNLQILRHLKQAGFKFIILGVESVNDETLQFLNKGESFTEIDSAISAADALGFDIAIYIIVGAPGEKYEDCLRSIMYARKYRNITGVIVSKLVPIKGTPYYDYALEHKLVNDPSIYYPQHEAYGTNERLDTNNPVEEIWQALLPAIGGISRFLAMRNKIRTRLDRLGAGSIGVAYLNRVTELSLHPALSAISGAATRLSRVPGLACRRLLALRDSWCGLRRP